MYANDNIHNPAGTKLVFQPDGNLVMCASTDDSRPIRASGTNGDNGDINARSEIWVGYDQLTNACE